MSYFFKVENLPSIQEIKNYIFDYCNYANLYNATKQIDECGFDLSDYDGLEEWMENNGYEPGSDEEIHTFLYICMQENRLIYRINKFNVDDNEKNRLDNKLSHYDLYDEIKRILWIGHKKDKECPFYKTPRELISYIIRIIDREEHQNEDSLSNPIVSKEELDKELDEIQKRIRIENEKPRCIDCNTALIVYECCLCDQKLCRNCDKEFIENAHPYGNNIICFYCQARKRDIIIPL
jgi:uncharacterized protein YutD